RIPVALAIAAISDQGSSEPLLLVQEADISARKRLDAMRDTVVAIREVIVTANGWDKAAPALLASLCAHLDWDAAQYWSVEGDRHALKLRNSWHKESSNVDGLDDPARNLSIESGGGLVRRAWHSGVAAAAPPRWGGTRVRCSQRRPSSGTLEARTCMGAGPSGAAPPPAPARGARGGPTRPPPGPGPGPGGASSPARRPAGPVGWASRRH